MKIIYIRTNKINGKQYVGQTNNLKQREWSWNCLKIPYANKILNSDRKAYGVDSFICDVLIECEDYEADKYEQYFITKYNTLYPNGYNMTTGGIKECKYNELTKDFLSKCKMGDKNPFYNKKHTVETKQKMSLSKKGKMTNNRNRKPVIQLSLNGDFAKKYETIGQASRETSIGKATIIKCCKGKCKTAGGYKWKYYE